MITTRSTLGFLTKANEFGYSARVLRDSINRCGDRLTTFELTYPRFVHAEFMTHRMFSRNAASSRAIPIETLIARVQEHPAMPIFWGKNKKGMQAAEELDEAPRALAKLAWLNARDNAVTTAQFLHEAGVHKQIVNRLLEPWMFITVIVTATEWTNFFFLRDSEFAQPEIAWVARAMKELYAAHEPQQRLPGEWHWPLVEMMNECHPLYLPEDFTHSAPLNPTHRDIIADEIINKISTARCARVSYLTHDGRRDLQDDLRLHDHLSKNGHWSPFEHVAQAMDKSERSGNFVGWSQYRKQFANENHGRKI